MHTDQTAGIGRHIISSHNVGVLQQDQYQVCNYTNNDETQQPFNNLILFHPIITTCYLF